MNAGQTVFIADGKPDYFGSNFIGYVAPRRGAAPPRVNANAQIGGTYGMWSALRAGATTIFDVGTMPGGPDVCSLADAVQDRYLDILMAEAVATGRPMHAQGHLWDGG